MRLSSKASQGVVSPTAGRKTGMLTWQNMRQRSWGSLQASGKIAHTSSLAFSRLRSQLYRRSAGTTPKLDNSNNKSANTFRHCYRQRTGHTLGTDQLLILLEVCSRHEPSNCTGDDVLLQCHAVHTATSLQTEHCGNIGLVNKAKQISDDNSEKISS